MQINLNHCWAAQKLLKQTVLDQSINVVLVSEQLRNPTDNVNWVSSNDSKCAVVAIDHSTTPIEDRGSGTGFAWINLGSLVIYSCYYTPNCSAAEFEEYLGRLDDSIRVQQNCQVELLGLAYGTFSMYLRLEIQEAAKLVGFADDITLVITAPNADLLENIGNTALQSIDKWMQANGLQMAPQKSEAVVLTNKWAYRDSTFILGR
ncbi:hypothetical protein QTP88_028651 [Uroleucon formosanum]